MRARSPFRLLLSLTWLGLLLSVDAVWAQGTPPRETAVKAAFLYKFASFVDWPAGTFPRPDQPLVIGVTGGDELAADLEQLVAGRTVEGRPVSARRVPDGAQASGVHILYVASRREPRLRESLDAVAGPVLLVTDQPGALRLGSVINFSSEAGRIRFSASLASAEARGLKLSARLLAVAQVIEGRTR